MSTPNFNIKNQAFMLDDLQTEMFFNKKGSELEYSNKKSNGKYGVWVVEKFNTANVLFCSGYYEGGTFDYDIEKNKDDFDIDYFLEGNDKGYLDNWGIKNYAKFHRKKINQLTKVDWLKAIGEYFFNNLYFLSDYDINLFKGVKFTHRNKKDFVCGVLSKILDYDIERAKKRLYELADEYGAKEIVCMCKFSNGEAIYQKKAS